jgi:hypothetical protein
MEKYDITWPGKAAEHREEAKRDDDNNGRRTGG